MTIDHSSGARAGGVDTNNIKAPMTIDHIKLRARYKGARGGKKGIRGCRR
jgi:hypothetical protein